MIPAIQIVIDKYFPVTMDVITLSCEVVQITQSKRSHPLHQSTKKLHQRSRLRIQIYEDKFLPRLHLHRNKSIVLAFEVLHSLELRHPLEFPVEPVIPSVIGTMQDRRLPARLRHDCRRVMPADVIKRPQHTIIPTHRQQRLSRHRCRQKLTRLFDLLRSPDHLPGPRENRLPLQIRNPRVHIPWRRNRRRLRQRRRLVITRNNLLNCNSGPHAFFSATCTFPGEPMARRNNSTNCSTRLSFSSGTGPDLRKSPGSNSSVSSAS